MNLPIFKIFTYKQGGITMYFIKFIYKDEYTHGQWREQSCTVSSLEECKKIYGLGIDCEYQILSIEPIKKSANSQN